MTGCTYVGVSDEEIAKLQENARPNNTEGNTVQFAIIYRLLTCSKEKSIIEGVKMAAKNKTMPIVNFSDIHLRNYFVSVNIQQQSLILRRIIVIHLFNKACQTEG